ncbi:Enzyme that catalyzes the fourth step in the histidine pathway [Linnemannia hyalina]|uniref:1-(5-phosphoribosyl)-5-[(5-phosphoribosylamino)methylideneamino] imidazole-4-carboxamide isomerase n=1 Tax=Linnemannia hyalina TaxID=64524 RepID=A0A9P7XYC5_9FUNG|nr:Enzyme that catalyzes the fourth step in the histidine pathway [Linnemannia hyalina]
MTSPHPRTAFRPCIDLHSGQVKQIVGGSLNDKDESQLKTNFVSSYYASLYRKHNLTGAHVIKLGPGNDDAAKECLRTWPDGLQVGGGITLDNAQFWIDAGAAKVIVTSYLFPGAKFSLERLQAISEAVGKDRLVVDVSCRKRGTEWIVAMDKWQTMTDMKVNKESLDILTQYCSEFLVHAADVEGLCKGIDEDLVKALGEWTTIPTTYAGGANALGDLELVDRLSSGKVDLTYGSALDVFGGKTVKFDDCVAWNHAHAQNTNPFHPDNMTRSATLSRVLVQSNVLHILIAHALSTEKEEIMGMLMGDWITEGTTEIARVDGVSLLTRSEKRKDRVEIGPEQLTMAAIEAEEITKATGKTTRVIGWSSTHYDLRTQLSQQLMDSRFIGMIVSCFNKDSELSNKIQVTCFQSRPDDSTSCQHIKLPFSVLNENPLDSLTLPKLLEIPERIFDEQRQSFYKSIPVSATSATTNPSSTAAAKESAKGKSGRLFSFSPTRAFSFSSSSSKDQEGDTVMSPVDDHSSDEQATNRSKGGRGSMDDIPADELNTKMINHRAMSLPDRMTLIRNSGVYVQSLSSLVDNLVGPTLQMLVDREQYNQSMLEALQAQKQALVRQLKSPRFVSGGKDLVDISDE